MAHTQIKMAKCERCVPLMEMCGGKNVGEEIRRMARLAAQGITMPSFAEATRLRMMCVLMLERTSMVLAGMTMRNGRSVERVALDGLGEIGIDESCVVDGDILLSPAFVLRKDGDAFRLEITEPESPFVAYAYETCAKRIQDRRVPEEVATYAWRALHECPEDKESQSLRIELRHAGPAQAVSLLFGLDVRPRDGWRCAWNRRPLWLTAWCVSGAPRAALEARVGVSLSDLLLRLSASGEFNAYVGSCQKCLQRPLLSFYLRRCTLFELSDSEINHLVVSSSIRQLHELAKLARIDGDPLPTCFCGPSEPILLVSDEHSPDFFWRC